MQAGDVIVRVGDRCRDDPGRCGGQDPCRREGEGGRAVARQPGRDDLYYLALQLVNS